MLLRIQLKAIMTNVSRNTIVVTNLRSNKGFRISHINFGFHTFITFLRLWHKDSYPKVVEEEGPEETAYPKPVISELGFGAPKTSSSFALDILSI